MEFSSTAESGVNDNDHTGPLDRRPRRTAATVRRGTRAGAADHQCDAPGERVEPRHAGDHPGRHPRPGAAEQRDACCSEPGVTETDAPRTRPASRCWWTRSPRRPSARPRPGGCVCRPRDCFRVVVADGGAIRIEPADASESAGRRAGLGRWDDWTSCPNPRSPPGSRRGHLRRQPAGRGGRTARAPLDPSGAAHPRRADARLADRRFGRQAPVAARADAVGCTARPLTDPAAVPATATGRSTTAD